MVRSPIQVSWSEQNLHRADLYIVTVVRRRFFKIPSQYIFSFRLRDRRDVNVAHVKNEQRGARVTQVFRQDETRGSELHA